MRQPSSLRDAERELIGLGRIHLDRDRRDVGIGGALRRARLVARTAAARVRPRLARLGRDQEGRRRLEVGRDVVDRRQGEGDRRQIAGIGERAPRQREAEQPPGPRREALAPDDRRRPRRRAAPASAAMASAAPKTVSAAGGSAARMRDSAIATPARRARKSRAGATRPPSARPVRRRSGGARARRRGLFAGYFRLGTADRVRQLLRMAASEMSSDRRQAAPSACNRDCRRRIRARRRSARPRRSRRQHASCCSSITDPPESMAIRLVWPKPLPVMTIESCS